MIERVIDPNAGPTRGQLWERQHPAQTAWEIFEVHEKQKAIAAKMAAGQTPTFEEIEATETTPERLDRQEREALGWRDCWRA